MIDMTAQDYLQEARFHAGKGSYEAAYNSYLKVLELDSELKESIEYEFRTTLSNYNEHLAHSEEDYAQIYKNFVTAMELYPGNTHILCNIGKHLVRNSLHCEALCHFDKALLIDPNMVAMEKKFDEVKRFVFPNKHFRYLNDFQRKSGYFSSIHEIIYRNKIIMGDLVRVAERIMGNDDDLLSLNKQTDKFEISDLISEDYVTLFVMNKFGPGLFDDKLLDLLKTTFEGKFLGGGRIIPRYASYYIIGAKCDRIHSRIQLGDEAKQILGIPDLNVHMETASGESFYGEDVATYDDLEYVTEEQRVFEIDFNRYEDIMEKYNATLPENTFIKCIKDNAEINVIVGYFQLNFTGGDAVTTDPRSKNRTDAWPQAVFVDFIPRKVKNEEQTCVRILTKGGNLNLIDDTRGSIMRLSASTIAFLNDSIYVKAILGSIGLASTHLTQLCDPSMVEIADLCPFPLFGLMMLKRGARSLVCYARSLHDKIFFERVFQTHGIPPDKVRILTTTKWNVFKNRSFHAIIYNALDLTGDINVPLCRIIYHLRFSHLVDGGLTFPANVKLIGQLISSDRLDTLYKLRADGAMSSVADHINAFQVSQALNVDPDRLEHEALSEPVVISASCHHMGSQSVTVKVKKDGMCNAVLCWYEVSLVHHEEGFSTNRRGSFIDSTAFLVKKPIQMFRGDTVTLLRCVDLNGSYKVVIDIDTL